jgi:hypothetical protein
MQNRDTLDAVPILCSTIAAMKLRFEQPAWPNPSVSSAECFEENFAYSGAPAVAARS